MEGKKISFGFFKTKKADKPLVIANDEKKEYIECLEEQSIKVVGGEEVKTNAPLVIPMKPNTLVTAERLLEIASKVESALEEPEIKQEPVDTVMQDKPAENETLEQMAVRELMQQAKQQVKNESPNLAIPAPAITAPEGQKESTLDDYEAVPIQEFGMAMLRGMGWTPSKDGSKYKQPELRPKGLGLGADKVIKENKKKQTAKDSKGEELTIVKNSFVKITTGKYSGYYGKVVSLDEDNGRVMVDIAVKKEVVSLSEFMMQAVTKSEYDKESKVINADSYEEYKKRETSQKSFKQEEKSSSSQRRDENEKKERTREIDSNDYRRQRDNDSANGKGRTRERRDSSSSEERTSRNKKKDRRRYSSNDSLSDLSEDDRRQKHSKHKSRRRRSRSRSGLRKRSSTPEGKRDIDKKRKGKKKKRDRDRSPNYKKHRK